MSCLSSTPPDLKQLDYLVGPLGEIDKSEESYYQLADQCMSAAGPGISADVRLFTRRSPLPPPLQQMTYRKWKAGISLGQHWSRWRKKKVIYIQPIDDFPPFVENFTVTGGRHEHCKPGFLELLRDFAEIFFAGFEVVILKTTRTRENGWRVTRRTHELTNEEQLLVTDLHRCLGEDLPGDGSCILGISWTDLYPCEELNFVLGEAAPNLKCAMFSFGRFQPRLFREGHPPPPLSRIDGDIIWKMIKVICHETCHVFYLSHCGFFECLMNESGSVQEALAQPLFLCPICMRKLQKVCKFDVRSRYVKLLEFLVIVQKEFPSPKMDASISWLRKCTELFEDND